MDDLAVGTLSILAVVGESKACISQCGMCCRISSELGTVYAINIALLVHYTSVAVIPWITIGGLQLSISLTTMLVVLRPSFTLMLRIRSPGFLRNRDKRNEPSVNDKKNSLRGLSSKRVPMAIMQKSRLTHKLSQDMSPKALGTLVRVPYRGWVQGVRTRVSDRLGFASGSANHYGQKCMV